jgi:long-chain acyl-CoA synthetase
MVREINAIKRQKCICLSAEKPWLQFYSEETISSPLPECTIFEYLRSKNKNNLNCTALNYFNRKIKYSELFKNIDKAARAFTAIGVKKNDIVTICSVTLPETIYSFYALNCIGTISNMIDPKTNVSGIKNYIDEVGSRVIVCLDSAYPKISQAIKDTHIEKVIVLSPMDSLPQPKKLIYSIFKAERTKGNNTYLKWESFIENGTDAIPIYAAYKKNNCCVIVHTGGTTGTPKGVMLSNDNINCAAFQCEIAGFDFKQEHKWMDIMPTFIAYGIGNGLHLPLSMGMEVILIPVFNPKEFDKLIKKYHPNHMAGVPSHWENLLSSQLLSKEDLSFILTPIVGADTMNYTLEEKSCSFLKNHSCKNKIVKGYGMAECCAAVSACATLPMNKLGSVGAPFSHTIISIFDFETLEELEPNQLGEVCILSPNNMLGYYNNAEETNKVFKVHNDGKKWLHSGDIGYMDKEGRLYIKDRAKRIIIRHDGFKVFPSTVEKAVMGNSNVEDCCVIGVSDTSHTQGKLPYVYIAKNKNSKKNENRIIEELKMLCKNELSEYSQPVGFEFIDTLPLTLVGKTDYIALEKKYKKDKLNS